MHSDLEN